MFSEPPERYLAAAIFEQRVDDRRQDAFLLAGGQHEVHVVADVVIAEEGYAVALAEQRGHPDELAAVPHRQEAGVGLPVELLQPDLLPAGVTEDVARPGRRKERQPLLAHGVERFEGDGVARWRLNPLRQATGKTASGDMVKSDSSGIASLPPGKRAIDYRGSYRF